MRLRTKTDLYEWLLYKYNEYAHEPSVQEFIKEISDLYLPDMGDKESKKTYEERLYRDMRNVYSTFCETVLMLPVQFDGSDAKALKEVMQYFTKMAKLRNRKNKNYVTDEQLYDQVLSIWRIVLRKDIWESLPEFVRNWTRVRQMAPKMSNILNIIRDKNKTKYQGLNAQRIAKEEGVKETLYMIYGKPN